MTQPINELPGAIDLRNYCDFVMIALPLVLIAGMWILTKVTKRRK